tara:strand:+ start:108 stop:866 length:759 start_codon:yes stop_codon:yes gene_type:complete
MASSSEVKKHEVVAIIDRSGSMFGKENDTIGGINSAIEVLKTEPEPNTDVKVSIKLFDHEEFMLIRSIDLQHVRPLETRQFKPRGQTALLDAIGNTLKYFIEKKITNSNAYHVCTVYIVTDGLENCSKHYNLDTIKEMISNAEENYSIKILYLAANQDAILEANKFGIAADQAMNYNENTENVDSAFRGAASAARRHVSGHGVSFTHAERMASQPAEQSLSIPLPPPVNVDRSRSNNISPPPRMRRQKSRIS